MRFLYAVVGVPQIVYDSVYSERNYIVQGDGEFFGAPVRRDAYGYSTSYLDIFLREFAARIGNDHYRQLDDTGFAVIYVSYGIQHDRQVQELFFPSTMTMPVEWTLDHGTPAQIRASKNILVEALRLAVGQAKTALDALRNEATKRCNKTPLLLPLRNFDSRCFVTELRQLQEGIRTAQDKQAAIDHFVGSVEAAHPPQPVPAEGRRKIKLAGFMDDHRVLFAPPGRDRHAFARPTVDHPPSCLLSGRRRLGAPYEAAFHYDCTRGPAALTGNFFGCHESAAWKVGDPHLNIAPNDFVRV